MAKSRQVHKRHVNEYHQSLFSETFLHRQEGEVFKCGTYTLTLRELAHDLDYPFPLSARRLHNILFEHDIKSLKGLANLGLHGLANLSGVGDSLCAVATIILDHAGFDLNAFCGWNEDESPVRFSTLKEQQRSHKAARRKRNRADHEPVPSDFTQSAALH